MDQTVFLFLLSDGVISGAIYALIAVSLVLTFNVTRVIAVFVGELAVFAPLTYAVLLTGKVPGTVWLSAAMLVLWAGLERERPRTALPLLGAAGATVGLAYLTASATSPWLLWPAAVLLVLPIGAAAYRVFYQPKLSETVLFLLIQAVGIHFVLQGLGLVFFGPEQLRPPPLLRGTITLLGVPVARQALLVLLFAFLVLALLGWLFNFTVIGKALRASAMNRRGAMLMGIDPFRAGMTAFLLTSLVAGVAGMLVAPITNVGYYSGFSLGIKGFVVAILAGFASYPLVIAGALFMALVESFSAFYASAYREVLVFALILPVLFWRSVATLDLGGDE